MKLLPILTFSSVFAAVGLASAAEPGAPGSHPVAPGIHAPEERAQKTIQPSHGAAADPGAAAMRDEWYGWQSLSTDGAALLLLIAAGASSDQRGDASAMLGYGALGVYLLGGPVTHFAHENYERGLGSLVLRAGVPVAFGAIGYGLEDCSGDADYDLCGIGGLFLGGVVGIATAIVVDAAVLGYDEVPVEREGLQNVGVSVTPDGALFVAGGKF